MALLLSPTTTMAKALSVIRTSVRTAIGNPSTTEVSNADIDAAINDSYDEVVTRFRHPEIESSETITTVSGTATDAVPADYWYTLAMRDETNSKWLRHRPLEWVLQQDNDTNSQPAYYTHTGSNFIFSPTPDGAYSITHYYVKVVTALSADADTTVFIHRTWDEIIKYGALWRLFQDYGEYDRMIHSRNVWRTLINSMPETETLNEETAQYIIGPIQPNESEL